MGSGELWWTFSAHYQHPHLDLEEGLAIPLSLRDWGTLPFSPVAEGLEFLTWLYPCQQHVYTQDILHSPQLWVHKLHVT